MGLVFRPKAPAVITRRGLIGGLGALAGTKIARANVPPLLTLPWPATGGVSFNAPLPLDIVPGVWTAAYGICALTRKWLNGPLFNIVVNSNTYTINAVNGHPDVNRLALLLGINPKYGIGGAPCSQLFDQSGNGNNATQSTSGNQMVIALINGQVVLMADGWVIDVEEDAAGYDKYFTIPSGASIELGSCSFYTVCQNESTGCQSGGASEGSSIFGVNGSGIGYLASGTSAGTPPNYWIDSGGTNYTSTLIPEVGPVVQGWMCGASSVVVNQNEETTTIADSLGSATVAGGILGAFPYFSAALGFYGRMWAWMVAGSTVLSSAQQAAVKNACYSLFRLPYNKTSEYNLVIDGASMEQGVGGYVSGVQGLGMWEQAYPFFTTPMRICNTSVTGSQVADRTTAWSTIAAPCYKSGAKNYLLACGSAPGNSLSNGVTPADTWSDVQTYISTATASLDWAGIFVQTLFSTPNGNATTQLEYNDLVYSGYAGEGAILLDYYSSPTMGNFQQTSNAVFYNLSGPSADHPTVYGYSQLVPYIVQAMNAAIA